MDFPLSLLLQLLDVRLPDVVVVVVVAAVRAAAAVVVGYPAAHVVVVADSSNQEKPTKLIVPVIHPYNTMPL